MGRMGFNFAPAKAPALQQDAEIAAGADGKNNEDAKAAEIYFDEGTNSKIKAMRLLVLALLVTCVFMSAFIALPQLTRLCQIDSNSDVNYKVYENITRLMEMNEEYLDKINSLSLQLQAANDRKEELENILGSSGLLISSLDGYNPIFNSESGNNNMPIIADSVVEEDNLPGIPSLEDESLIDTIY